jgi:PAS domain S-box-containing protein
VEDPIPATAAGRRTHHSDRTMSTSCRGPTVSGMPPQDGWPALFASAFLQSRNAMVLVDEQRRIVDANPALLQLLGQARGAVVGRPMWELVVDGPEASPAEWRELLSAGRFTGDTVLRHADGREVAVQWGASTEVATGRRLVLFVILNTSRWGGRFRAAPDRRGRHRSGDRGRAADQPRHGAYARAQRDVEGGRALACTPRREGPRRRLRADARLTHQHTPTRTGATPSKRFARGTVALRSRAPMRSPAHPAMTMLVRFTRDSTSGSFHTAPTGAVAVAWTQAHQPLLRGTDNSTLSGSYG